MGKVKQFELWRECNCKCTFCTLGDDNCKTPDEIKLKNMRDAYNEIRNYKAGEVDTIGFIGGEFFQGQLTDNHKIIFGTKWTFMDLMRLCNSLLNNEVIKNVSKQFDVVQKLLQREDITEIYNAGDSGREGEYIQRLVFMMAFMGDS